MAYKHIKKQIELRAITISLQDVLRIFERLSRHLEEEADRQLKELVRPADKSEEDFKKYVAAVRADAFRITVTIAGADGSDLFGDSQALFSSPNLPNDIRSIYMTNSTAYQGHTGRRPPNGFELMLDFEAPPLIDNNNPVSNPTPNRSHLTADGDRDSWVASIVEAVVGAINHRGNRRDALHAAFVYDVGLMCLGLPLSLYLCWRLSGLVDATLGTRSQFLSSAAYVYLTFIGIWFYRVLFGYSRWAFPSVELEEKASKSKRHRYVLYAILLAIVSNAAYDIIKYASLS